MIILELQFIQDVALLVLFNCVVSAVFWSMLDAVDSFRADSVPNSFIGGQL